jgi:hypothetical protein
MEEFIAQLADTTIGETFNFYRDGKGADVRRARLLAYLRSRENARVLLVGEAAGYRGARVSGIPFTSERQLSGTGPGEATATIVHRVLAELGIEEDVLLWNIVPTHPGTQTSNRRPTRARLYSRLGDSSGGRVTFNPRTIEGTALSWRGPRSIQRLLVRGAMLLKRGGIDHPILIPPPLDGLPTFAKAGSGVAPRQLPVSSQTVMPL